MIVNGNSIPYEKNLTVAKYLAREQYRTDCIAVEINEEIVPKSQYDTRRFEQEDRIEIIHFVGGG